MKSLFTFGRTPAAAIDPATQMRTQDVHLLAVRTKERGNLAERVAAGLVDEGELEHVDREIRDIQRRIDVRNADLASTTERATRREHDMPGALNDLRADLDIFVASDLPAFVERVRELEAKTATFTRLYGHTSPHGATLGIPEWLCLAQGKFSFADVVSTQPTSRLTIFKNLAARFGFVAVAASKAA